MSIRKLLLGTTALVGVVLAGVAASDAAQVLPGGTFDITISGFAGFRAHGGDLDQQFNDDRISTGLDFSNDTEVHVVLRHKLEGSGIEYGGTVELVADTNRFDNTDESWIFVRGSYGELRFGDENGPVDASSVGAYTIAAGTGGIDGDVVDVLSVSAVRPTNSDDATKIRYYTPSFGGFQAGVGYTPNAAFIGDGAANGDSLALKNVEVGDLVEGALVYEGNIVGLGLQASLVGSHGDVKNETALGDDDFWTYYAGAAADVFGIRIAGGFGEEEVGSLERTYVNAGVGYGIGPVNVSLTYGQVLDSEGYVGDEPWNVVLSADFAILPGVVLAGDAAYFDNDLDREDRVVGSDNGWVYVTKLSLAF